MSIKNLLFCKGIEIEQEKGEWNKMEGFMCSGLAAAFYIKIGVIYYDRNIHSVRPGDFQSKKHIFRFKDKYSFGPEKIIEFSD